MGMAAAADLTALTEPTVENIILEMLSNEMLRQVQELRFAAGPHMCTCQVHFYLVILVHCYFELLVPSTLDDGAVLLWQWLRG